MLENFHGCAVDGASCSAMSNSFCFKRLGHGFAISCDDCRAIRKAMLQSMIERGWRKVHPEAERYEKALRDIMALVDDHLSVTPRHARMYEIAKEALK